MGKTYDEIKTGATTFADSAKILGVIGEAGVHQLKEDAAEKMLAHTMIPAIVLKAFSIELGFKALTAKNNSDVENKHKLNELFDNLSEEDQDNIRVATVSTMKINNPNYSDCDFDADLIKIANTFIDWRYFY